MRYVTCLLTSVFCLTVPEVGLGEAVQTDDGLKLHLAGDGRIERWQAGATSWSVVAGQVSGFQVREAGSETWTDVTGRVERAGNELLFKGTATDLALDVEARYVAREDRIDVIGGVVDTSKRERSIDLRYVAPVGTKGWRWWVDTRDTFDPDRTFSPPPIREPGASDYELWIDAYDMDEQMVDVMLVRDDGSQVSLGRIASEGANEQWRTFVVRGVRESDLIRSPDATGGRLCVRLTNRREDTYVWVQICAVYLVKASTTAFDSDQASQLVIESEEQLPAQTVASWRCLPNVKKWRATPRRGSGIDLFDGGWCEVTLNPGDHRVGGSNGVIAGNDSLVPGSGGRVKGLGFPWATVTHSGGSGLSMGLSADLPCQFEFGYDAMHGGLDVTYEFGLSSYPKRPEFKNRAPFHMVLYRTDDEWGFREATRRYYDVYPEPFTQHTDRFGFWVSTGKRPVPRHLAGMYAYIEIHEGGLYPDHMPDRATYEQFYVTLREHIDHYRGTGVHVLPYRHFYHMDLHMKGARDGTLTTMPKTYDAAMAALNTLNLPFAGPYGHHLEKVIHSSTMRTPDGKYDVELRSNPRQCDFKGRICFRTSINPCLYDDDPKVMTNARMEEEFARDLLARVPEVGGVYYDAGVGAGGVDYHPEHLKYARAPLVHGPGMARAVGKYAFGRSVGKILHPQGKISFRNSFEGFGRPNQMCWHFMGVDAWGREFPAGTGTRRLRAYRILSGPKPATFLFTPSNVTTRQDLDKLVHKLVAYNIWPGSISRKLGSAGVLDAVAPVAKAMQDMYAAGWQPVTYARCNAAHVEVERYGPRDGKAYFSLLNPSLRDADVVLTIDAKSAGMAGIGAAAEFFVVGKRLAPEQAAPGVYRVAFTLPATEVAVVQVGEREVDDPHTITDFYAAKIRAAGEKAD